ncbi:MAG: phosphatase PAP2 family protein [Candidatus Latescibacterota bacterium]
MVSFSPFHSGKQPISVLFLILILLPGTVSNTFPETAPGPFRLSPLRETAPIAAGLSLSLVGDRITSGVDAPDPISLRRDNIPLFDHAALNLHSDKAGEWSDHTRVLCTALPLFAAASTLRMGNRHSYTDVLTVLVMYAESSLLTHSLTSLAKGTFHRSRPYAYNVRIPADIRKERNAALSFWSGHASAAFNGAVFACTVFQSYHPDSPLVKPAWALGLTTAAATGWLRVLAGQHFPSDVIAGAAAGSFTGWLVPRLHRNESGAVAVSPTVNGAPGLAVSWEF